MHLYIMLDNSLFICYSTDNYSKLTDLFLNSLQDINVNNINHMKDEIDVSNKKTGFRSDLWYYCVRNKINHLINTLQNYDSLNNIKYFIFTDCDIIYIKKNLNEWYNLEIHIQNENKDIYFMRENNPHDVNTGFCIIQNNDNITNIINFFVNVLKTFDETDKKNMYHGDQTIINNLKSEINYGFIPNDYVIYATKIYNKKKSLFHHAVCTKDVNDKIKQIKQIKSAFK